jgi:Ser/Thr protein kinase RdoA (MazF antagonist)
MSEMATLDEILHTGRMAVLPRRFVEREAQMWLVDRDGQRGVLRRFDPDPSGTGLSSEEDRRWLHRFLAQLATTGFPSPKPIEAFNGASMVVDDEGALWELVEFIDGVEVGWSPQPDMGEIGVLLGHLHTSANQVPLPRQRPTALALETVPQILAAPLSKDVSPQLGELCGVLAAELTDDLRRVGHAGRPATIIHGDFTNHNVIARGQPPRAVGVIDFGLAHVAASIADLGYGLWRSGRPRQDSATIDLARAAAFVLGYKNVRQLDDEDVAAIPTYIFGRGLQMLAKYVQRNAISAMGLDQILWLRAHRNRLGEELVRVTRAI